MTLHYNLSDFSLGLKESKIVFPHFAIDGKNQSVIRDTSLTQAQPQINDCYQLKILLYVQVQMTINP